MRLGREFYYRDTVVVAKGLLGKVLVKGKRELIITETEAYLGREDLASHARFGPTQAKRIMWETGGLLYVYFIYGMYEMANIITGRVGEPCAVLLRAGIVPRTKEVIDGPGKLSKYLRITRQDKGVNLTTSSTLLLEDRGYRLKKIVAAPRIGVGYAGVWAKKKLRYLAEF